MSTFRVFGTLFLTFVITFGILDYSKNMLMKQSEYESVRSANQGSLLDVSDKYKNNEVLTTPEMVERWLVNFIDTHGLDYRSLKIGFVQIESEPPLYLVQIEGYKDAYAILSNDAYVRFDSGAMIVTDDIDDDIE